LEKFIIAPAFAGNFEVLCNDHFVSIKLSTINTYPMKYICDGFMPYKKQQKNTNKKQQQKSPKTTTTTTTTTTTNITTYIKECSKKAFLFHFMLHKYDTS
jgi:hypothetical protein